MELESTLQVRVNDVLWHETDSPRRTRTERLRTIKRPITQIDVRIFALANMAPACQPGPDNARLFIEMESARAET